MAEQQSPSTSPSDDVWAQAVKEFTDGNFEKALPLLEKLKTDPNKQKASDFWALYGDVHNNLQQFNEALQAFEEGLGIEPDSAGLLFRKGAALIGLQHGVGALQCFARVEEIDTKKAIVETGDFQALKSLAANQSGNPKVALQSTDQALLLLPENDEETRNLVRLQRAIASNLLRNPEQALNALSSIQNPGALQHGVLLQKAIALTANEQLDDARQIVDGLIKDAPPALRPRVLIQSAAIHIAAQNPESALQELEKLGEEGTPAEALPELLSQKCRVLLDLKRYEDVLEAGAALVDASPSIGDAALGYYYIAVASRNLDDLEGEVAALKEAVKGDTGTEVDVLIRTRYADILHTSKQYEAALEHYNTALETDSENAAALHSRASVLRDLGRYPETIAAVDQAEGKIKDQRQWADMLVTKAFAFWQQDEAEQAYAVAMRAAELDPKAHSESGVNALSDFMMAANKQDELFAFLDRVAESGSEVSQGVVLLTLQANAKLLTQHDAEAFALFRKAAEKPLGDDATWLAWLMRAAARIPLQDEVGVVQDLDKARSLAPDVVKTHPLYNLMLGVVALQTKDFDKMREAAQALLDRGVMKPLALAYMAAAEAAAGHTEAARPLIDESLTLLETISSPPLQALRLMITGDVLRQLEDYEGALKAFSDISDLSPVASVAQLIAKSGCALLLHRLDRKEDAMAAADEAVAMTVQLDESVPMRFFSFWSKASLLTFNDRFDEALEVIGRAYDIAPDEEAVLSTKADIEFELEDYEAAQASFKVAAEAAEAPDDRVSAWLRRGDALRKLERYEEAADSYRGVLNEQQDGIDAWMALGDVYTDLGRHQAARRAYHRGWALATPDEKGRKPMGLAIGVTAALLSLKEYRQVVEFTDQIQWRRLNSKKLAKNRGSALLELRDESGAKAALEVAAKGDDGITEAKNALRHLSQGVVGSPSLIGYWFGSGASPGRRLAGFFFFGSLLLVVGAGALSIEDDWPSYLAWLKHVNSDGALPLIITLAAIIAFPVIKSLKVGDFEVQPSTPSQPVRRSGIDEALKQIGNAPTGLGM
ncbi:MAG: tetratricopeptide repeat protein [Candidatus Tectomicrobia bacterium]|nr:tetratricopeptide repeat protein [Candidatus Tectomicrobia bacterium]